MKPAVTETNVLLTDLICTCHWPQPVEHYLRTANYLQTDREDCFKLPVWPLMLNKKPFTFDLFLYVYILELTMLHESLREFY